MSLLREAASDTSEEAFQAEATSTRHASEIGRIAHRVGGDLSDETLMKAHDAQIDFHEQEIREAEQRGMPPEQVDLHEWQAQLHWHGLASFGITEVTPVEPESTSYESSVLVLS
jgi:hypothetical protein